MKILNENPPQFICQCGKPFEKVTSLKVHCVDTGCKFPEEYRQKEGSKESSLGYPPYPSIPYKEEKKRISVAKITYLIAQYLTKHFHWYAEMSPTNRNRSLWLCDEDTGCYKENGQKTINEIIDEWLKERFKAHIVRETIERMFARNSNDSKSTKLGGQSHRILLKNGVYDLETNTFEPLTPDTYLEYHIISLPFDYDPKAKCPNIKKFLREILEENEDPKQDLRAILRFIGYCLYKDYPHAMFLILSGRGSNGKSCLIQLIREFLGPNNHTGMTPQEISEHRFKIAGLFGKSACIAGDVPNKPLEYTGKIKMLTGGDEVSAEFKGQDAFDFVNYAKLMFSCNQVPPVFDPTDAFHSRANIIDFDRQFPKRDPKTKPKHKLMKSLLTEKEYSGLFNLVLEPLKDLLKTGELFPGITVEEQRLRYYKRSDPVTYLIYKYCHHDPMGEMATEVLYNLYVVLCNSLKRFGHIAKSP